jgi:small-conductance mechanosensitive channel
MFETLNNYFPNEYVLAGAIFLLLFVLIRIGFFLVGRITLKLSPNTDKLKENKVLRRTSKALTLLAILIGIPLSLRILPLNVIFMEIIYKIIHTLIMTTIAFLIFIILDVFMINITKKIAKKNNLAKSLQPIIRGTLKIIIIGGVIIYGLVIWGVQVGPLLAGLGIAGLALALALQPVLGNLFNGLALLLDETFNVGDVIKLGSGEMGEVYSVGLRTTKIKTFDNEMIIIPNTKIADSIIQNFFQPDKSIRINLEFGVEYGNDPEYIKKIVLEEIEKINIIDKTQDIKVMFDKLGESSLEFKTMFWVSDISNKWPAHQEAISRVYRRLYKEKIGIPFPQRTVWLRDENKTKPITPGNKKFKEVQNKYFSDFGKEYIEEDKK